MKYYSTNEEDYNYSDLEEAAMDIWQDGTHKVGEEAEIHEGECVRPKASEFLGNIAEDMQDRACSEHNEYAECWTFTRDERLDLQAVVEAAVDKWVEENNTQPTFWRITDSRPITIKFTNDDGDFEIITP